MNIYSQDVPGYYHRIKGFQLSSSEFNKEGYIPKVNNITIGSTLDELIKSFGKPKNTSESNSCPGSTSKNVQATIYTYKGISFLVCKNENKIYQIEIMRK